MVSHRFLLLLLTSFILFTGCKGKKKTAVLSGDDPVEVSDFIEFFPEKPLAYQVTDSIWQRKEKDSLLISYKVFTQFVPDSIIGKVYGKNQKIKIYPMAKVSVSGGETYLFAKTLSADKKAVYLLSFDKKRTFIAGMPVLRPANTPMSQTVTLDRRYAITHTMQRKNADGTSSEGKEVYVLNNDAKNFILILTEALDDKPTELVNPIDTLGRKHKWSADYSNGKMNLVSIRDGRKADRISFFVHFEKNNGECTGELRGEALIRSSTIAEYAADGDPCKLKFVFSGSGVSLREIEGCGSRRGLRCSFDGSFAKKAIPKPKKKK